MMSWALMYQLAGSFSTMIASNGADGVPRSAGAGGGGGKPAGAAGQGGAQSVRAHSIHDGCMPLG